MIGTAGISKNMWRRNGRLNLPLNGLVLYAPLWHPELSGSPFLSKDLNAHSCTVTGATWGITGRTFDGADDFIDCGSDITISHTGSLVCWFKYPADASTRVLIANGNLSTDRDGYTLYISATDTLAFQYASAAAVINTTAIATTTTQWNLVCVTWDGTNIIPYLNGTAGTTLSQTIDNAITNPLRIGRAGAGTDYYGKGQIGEVAVFNRALSAIEVQNLRLATKWKYS